MGPAVSWLWEIGMIPARLIKPTVGLMPTMPQIPDGHTIEPSVSVPRDKTVRFADVAAADPELEPHGLRSRTYGFLHWPPRALHPLEELKRSDVGPFAQIGFSKDNRAGLAESLCNRRILRRNGYLESKRTGRGRHLISCVDVVFEKNGNAVQPTARTFHFAFRIQRISDLKCVWI